MSKKIAQLSNYKMLIYVGLQLGIYILCVYSLKVKKLKGEIFIKSRVFSIAVAMSMMLSLSTTAFAGYTEITHPGGIGWSDVMITTEDSESIPDGYQPITEPGSTGWTNVLITSPNEQETPSNPGDDYPENPEKCIYVITLHFEGSDGSEEIQTTTGEADLGALLPWEKEKLPMREFEGDTYMLVGFTASNFISKIPEHNVADLYYLLDSDNNQIPDKWQGTDLDKMDYTIKLNYDDGIYVEQSVLRNKSIGSKAIDMQSIDRTKTLKLDDAIRVYQYTGIDAKSLYVTDMAEDNVATIYYKSSGNQSTSSPNETKPDVTKPDDENPATGNPVAGKPDSSSQIGGSPWYPGNLDLSYPFYWGVDHSDKNTDKKPVKDDTKLEPSKNPPVNDNLSYTVELDMVNHKAYIKGYPDGTVGPMRNITRSEVAMILYRLMTEDSRTTYYGNTSSFVDVSANSWYNEAICTVYNAGLIKGYSDGTFRPNENMTRAEVAAVISRFVISDKVDGSTYSDTTGHWAEDYINKLGALGWMNGYGDGTFIPNAYITRAEAATVINKLLQRTPNMNHLLPNMIIWPDNPITSWYYLEMQEATNSHTYNIENTDYEIWVKILEGNI